MLEAVLYGGLLRFAQALLSASPFIVAGLVVAGVFRRLLGPENTRRLFGGNTWRSIPQAWAIGMLLPVCSLGAIPVARELRRAGLSGGTILAFALAAPLFNPLSLLYGLTLSEPFTILAFALCTLVVVTVVGLLWDRLFPHTAVEEPPPKPVTYGLRRLAAVAVVGAREMASPGFALILVGLAGVALLSVALPPGSLQTSLGHDNPYAPLLMAAVAVPAYVTPMAAMGQLGMMFQHGNSVGAAFTLLALGAGVNLGLIVWMLCAYGARKTAAWFALLVAVVLGLSYGVERPLYPDDVEAADHTHAFDVFCRPVHAGTAHPAAAALQRAWDEGEVYELFGVGILLMYCLVGWGLRVCDPAGRLESWLEGAALADGKKTAWYDVALPPSVLGGATLLGLVALSVAGCYAYYPPPAEIFEEMSIVRGEALGAALAGERKHAEKWLAIYDDWNRKLQVSVYLRDGALSDYHRMKSRLLSQRLELLEHELAHDDRDEVRRLVAAIERTHARMVDAYTTQR